MERRLICCFLLILSLAFSNSEAIASHTYGGELLYEHISGNNRYKVNLTIYGDCSGAIFDSLALSRPTIRVQLSGSTLFDVQLDPEPGTGKEVTPVCPRDSNNTACKKPPGTLPGIAKYVYTAEVTIPSLSADWSFVFDGLMGRTQAGRSNAISNILQGADGSIMYLVAELNNTNGPNSSPKYTSIPTPFFCINRPQEYNQGAIDPDGDALNFSLTTGLESIPGSSVVTLVNYVSPYTATAPLATAAGSFSYNSLNGQMSFTPNLGQVSLVVNKVEEYKNGVLVGSSMREMTFIVLNTCDNTPPLGKIDTNVTGGAAAPGNVVNVCQGTDHIAFRVFPVDADNNIISITPSNLPFGGVLNITNNNTTNPIVDFSWSPPVTQVVGAYTFYLNYKDDGCPLSSNQTIAYTINIVPPMTITHELLYPTQCAHNAYVRIATHGGSKPRIVDIIKGNDTIRSYSDSNSIGGDTLYVVADSFRHGVYGINAYSPYLKCRASYTMIIPDSGVYPYPPYYEDINACQHDEVIPISLRIDSSVLRLNWYDKEGVRLTAAPTYTTDSAKVFTWRISQTHGNCESEKVPFNVFIHPPPMAEILTPPTRVCIGDEVKLSASGGETYKWLPEDKVYGSEANYTYVKVMVPTTYSAIAKSRYGCLDTADVTYSDIEQCCTFSYPNAFTPNGDGKNDGFRALLYGNASEYHFSIYNRWGQRVFYTDDPKKYWDGTFNGKECEMGVYYYRVKGICLTGHQEYSSGDFTLLR